MGNSNELYEQAEHDARHAALRELKALCEKVAAIRKQLEGIVVTEGCDRGVVLLSVEGPTHWDEEAKCQVYNHENFSPLGDALIALYDLTKP